MTTSQTPAPLSDAQVRRYRKDGLVNVASGLGTSKSKRSQNKFEYGTMGNWQQLDAAYQTNWIAQKIVDAPAEDMTREWRRIKCESAEDIVALEDKFDVQNKVQEAVTWGRLYGGAGILMVTDQDLDKPLNPNMIKKGGLKQLIVFDRYDLTAMSIQNLDVLSPNYLQPEYYTLRNGAQRIHYTHVAKFLGKKLPRRWQEKTLGWGDSVLRKCIEDVADMVAAKDGIAELMQEANIDVIKAENLAEDLASDQDQKIIERYEMFSQMKSVVNMALLDSSETMERQTLNLSGVAPIIEQFITWISAAADIPVTRMFGTSAKGMNATGEGDEKNYHNSLRSAQSRTLSTPMRTLDEVIVRSATGGFPDDYSYEWNPLSVSNPLETAQAGQLVAQTNVMYLNESIVTRSQVMRELQANEIYQFNEEELDELEEMEAESIFEEVVDPVEGEAIDPMSNVKAVDTNIAFAAAYQVMLDNGLDHGAIADVLNG
jgi:phage-related protein (TIGR01555 family)